ncbi:hypothetical protein EXIGLDRAFT_419651 [Exidia glandulosa HHB12029]|uniref:Uncharacterized protein n=1 Tax=Exidia glandulosa HHB12029 TaxID=1314781 RepID=A0A165PV23_EXIGL|nr:hypothetical protein EXIGLDRAFT_419651 [Exidia glandulosa HHB12029]
MSPAPPAPSILSVTFRGQFQSFTPPSDMTGVSIELIRNEDGSTTATLDLSAHDAAACTTCKTPTKLFLINLIDEHFQRLKELTKSAHRRSADYVRLHTKNYSRRVEEAVRRNSLTDSEVESDLDVTQTPFRERRMRKD